MKEQASPTRTIKRSSPSAGGPGFVHWLLLVVAGAGLLGLLTLAAEDAAATRAEPGSISEATTVLSLDVPPLPAELQSSIPEDPALRDPTLIVTRVTVSKGDNLAAIFARQRLSPQDLQAIMDLGGVVQPLKKIAPGQELILEIDSEQRLAALTLEVDRLRRLHVRRSDQGFVAQFDERTPETRVAHASGSIHNSLFADGQAAGLSDAMIMEMAGIFGWDIDFALDIRENDRFSVIFEELYLDGEKIGNGAILAAEFINEGKSYRAVRYAPPGSKPDYYTPDGRGMRKAFLRTPVDFSRISSGFGIRHHPVLDRVRHHNGVDYAAPTGTPIRAAGAGKVQFKGIKGGYGRTLVIQHAGENSTLYAHMSRFASSVQVGSRVTQGQIIGYVGQSGLATGPHLHYEFRIAGVHRNPLTVKLPQSEPIRAEYRPQFDRQSHAMLTRLDLLQRGTLAANAE